MADDAGISDERMSELLESVATDPRITSRRRADVRAAMLDEFEAAAKTGSRPFAAEAPDDAAEAPDARLDIETIGAGHGPSRMQRRPRILLVAACVVAIAGLVALLVTRNTEGVLESAAGVSLDSDNVQLPFELLPSTYLTDAVGAGVAFEVPVGLVLVRLDDGFVRFELAEADRETDGPFLTLQDTTVSAREFADSIVAWAANGSVIATETPVATAEGDTIRWELQLPQTFFCPVFPECGVPPVLRDMDVQPRLRQEIPTYLTILQVGDRNVLVVERPGDEGDPISLAATSIVASLAVGR